MRFSLMSLFLGLCLPFLTRGLLAQGETAVPFLLFEANPDANGWGGVSTAVVSDNPAATIANPAQLGMFSLDHFFSASTYVPKTEWSPENDQNDITYNVSAVSAGVNLQTMFGLALPISIGVGYSRVYFDMGNFVRTGSGSPQPIGFFNAHESSESFCLGLGMDYFVRIGVGMNFKSIVSTLSPIGTEQEAGSGTARGSATDFGVLAQIPVMEILSRATGSSYILVSTVEPLFDINFGYTHNNVGEKMSYIDAAQSDPLPRNATVGLSMEMGVVMPVNNQPWKILTFTLAREAQDLLIIRKPDGVIEYQSGLGDISFFKHVIRGELYDNDRVDLRKGWQVNFGEVVSVRGGSFSESPNFGNRNYVTSGFGIRAAGFLKLLVAMNPETQLPDALLFISNHVDLIYDHAAYTTSGPLGETTFNALGVVIR